MTFFLLSFAFPEGPEEGCRSPQEGAQLKITPETLVVFGLPAAFLAFVGGRKRETEKRSPEALR